MASSAPPTVPMGNAAPQDAALQQTPWPKRARLASGLARLDHAIGAAGFDRGPWLVVGFGAGIASWFVTASPSRWLTLGAVLVAIVTCSLIGFKAEGRFPWLRQALAALALSVLAGLALVWAKSALVGTVPIARPLMAELHARVLDREERPAEGRVRLVVQTREPDTARPIRVRLNLPVERDREEFIEGAVIRVRARLMPPAPPMLPGGYDFARTAWFAQIAATGTVLGDPTLVEPGREALLADVQRALSAHVRANLSGSPGAIAAAFASGDRGAIAEADDTAMRDAGLTHLLSISGLHVSAVIAAAYFLALRLLSLWPWLALRVRLPLLAAATGALAGVGYTLLTGAEVPTVRSCLGSLLVLAALVLGREPLSLRMVAVAAFLVLLLWPEAIVGPSFQMSFAAVITIVALHGSAWVRSWTAAREEPWWAGTLRHLGGLLLTGVAIELALMPIGLFHFHRAGAYGALANVIAIPLTTFVSMPMIALALLFDVVGAGAPFWWVAGKSLELLLALAHWTAGMPGAVTVLPAMGRLPFALFLAGGLWLALWSTRIRWLGLAPAIAGAAMLSFLSPPDVLVSGDGRHVGIVDRSSGRLLVLRDGRAGYASETLLELSGMDGQPIALDAWPGAHCNPDFCAIVVTAGGRKKTLLMSRGDTLVSERELAAACELADVVISDRYLPRSCRPRWIKADRRALGQSGGMTIDIASGTVRTVAQDEGRHGWWRPAAPRAPRPPHQHQ